MTDGPPAPETPETPGVPPVPPAPPVWATSGARSHWSDRVLPHLHLLAGAALAAGTAANVIATGWTYWNFAGPDGSLAAGERLRVALGAAVSPTAAALLVLATLVVASPHLGRGHHGTPVAARRLLLVLVAAQALYALGALVAVIDAFALFEPARRGRFDIPFGQTGPTRLLRVVTLAVGALGATLALAASSRPRRAGPVRLDVALDLDREPG